MKKPETGNRGPEDRELVGISRRDALKSLGAAVPMAAGFGLAAPEMERVAEFMASLDDQAQQPAAYRPKFFTAPEWATIKVLVDYIIPRDEKSGSATDAKVPEYLDFVLSDTFMTTEPNRVSFHGGMGWIDLECRRRYDNKTFLQASDAQRKLLLDDIAYPRRAKPEHATGTAFFSRLRDMTASGFFSSAMGWKDLQYMGNVHVVKWDGCPPEANARLGVTQEVMKTRIPMQRG
jgi:gluconate 2-dehydrogenase gamma chain